MHRGTRLLMAFGVVGLLAGCDDPTAPTVDAMLAKGTLADGPSFISAGALSTSEIAIGWDDRSRNESGFELHRSTTGAAGEYHQLVRVGGNVTSYGDRGLNQGTEYCYRVRSFRTTGKTTAFSDFTDAACVRTKGPPAAPTDVNAVPAAHGIVDVSWVTPPAPVTYFRVERAALADGPWTTIASPVATSSYQDRNRPAETQVCYRVIAVNADGDSPPSSADCTTPPATPADLVATASSASTVDLTWADQSASEDGFEIQRSVDNQIWSVIATPPANVTVHVDVGLTADTRYFYRVRARKDGGHSAFSAVASAVPVATLPPSPTEVNAFGSGSTYAQVVWASTAANVSGFRVERSTNGRLTWETVATLEGAQRWAVDGDRTPNQTVCYRVIALNLLGESPPSADDCVTLVATVTDLKAAPAGNGSIDLTWSNPAPGIANGFALYYLQRYNVGYCYNPYGCYGYDQWIEIARLDPDATSYRVSGLSPILDHQFYIQTIAPDAVSDGSEIVIGFTEPLPPAPSGLTATILGPTSVELRWTDNSTNETNFVVVRCTGAPASCPDNAFAATEWLTADVTSWTDTSVQPGLAYTYKVIAYNGVAWSEWSNVATVTMPAQTSE